MVERPIFWLDQLAADVAASFVALDNGSFVNRFDMRVRLAGESRALFLPTEFTSTFKVCSSPLTASISLVGRMASSIATSIFRTRRWISMIFRSLQGTYVFRVALASQSFIGCMKRSLVIVSLWLMEKVLSACIAGFTKPFRYVWSVWVASGDDTLRSHRMLQSFAAVLRAVSAAPEHLCVSIVADGREERSPKTATQAWLGIGSLLEFYDNVSTWYNIIECTTLKGPTTKRAVVDVTNHNSASQTREYINGLIDPGSMTFTANWVVADPSQNSTTGYRAVFNNGTRYSWRILLSNPTANVVSFTGLAISISSDLPIDKQATFDGEIKITGPVTVV